MKDTAQIREKAFALAQRIIDENGPRLAGTEATKKAAKTLEQEMGKFADKTELESFHLYQGAFLGWIKILVASYALGVTLLWFDLPLIALAVAILSILILVLQFFFYLPIIDKLYPKKDGYNVVGYIEPTDEVKSQVIISGHHDSAQVFNFFIHQPKLYNLRTTGSIVLVILLSILSLALYFITNDIFGLVAKIVLSLGFLLTGQMWFFASKQGTPGAGDNLIASTTALEIGRHFKENKLKHTRIIIASFDAEEEGLRGARAFAKLHKQSFEKFPTTLLNTDCAYNLKDLFFLTSDVNGTVKMDEELANELVKIAAKNKYSAEAKPISFLTGGTDAGELARVGVKATTLIGMPWSNNSRSSVYHTPNDTLDHVEKEIIDATITIFTEYVEQKDQI
ncbi:MAG: M20/M25/M40 family metallo-hydrolase [Bacilli bacterium]|nr:M20/M25/M40 family metallo-hydrolase [Bacilli bacterium]MBN2696531.1 M20/M25/M40 family metallo-hydrolase [Bacilli bacterium]